MTKQLITVIGLIVSLGVIALGVMLIAAPVFFQSLAVDAQTATVVSANRVHQADVDNYAVQLARSDVIVAAVTQLQSEIPATAHLDDVFEIVGNAASTSGVVITSITAGQAAPFVARVGITDETTTPAVEAAPSEDGAEADAAAPAENSGIAADGAADSAAVTGRQQVDFRILVTAADMLQVGSFLDALRSGPRLFSTVTSLSATTGVGIEVTVDGLTFVDGEG